MTLTYRETVQHPGTETAVREDGRPTEWGRELAADLVAHAKSLEIGFATLRTQMDEYERFWKQDGVQLTTRKDDELARALPHVPNAKGRILGLRTIRANVKDRVNFKISLNAQWPQAQRNATQDLERFCYGAIWMGDIERQQRLLGELQPTLAWFLALRGCAVAIPVVRTSTRAKESDPYGDDAPFVIRTPDPYQCVWQTDHRGVCFYASIDRRPGSDYYRDEALKEIRPDRDGSCEHVNVWWLAEDGDVWNAAVVGGVGFHVAPTNHTQRGRKLKRLPVFIDAPFGSPQEAVIAQDEGTSLADHYQGILENNKENYATENYLTAVELWAVMRGAMRGMAVAAERTPTVEEKDKFFSGRSILNVGLGGRVFEVAGPEVTDTATRLQAKLDQWQQLGGMPNTALSGVSEGMTGVAIQERMLDGDFMAGPVSDALRRLYQQVAGCYIHQVRALRRSVKMQGIDSRRSRFAEKIDASFLPPPEEYLLQAIHKPSLIRDGLRNAQEAVTWSSAGRSWAANADDYFDDPGQEVALSEEQQLDMMPEIKLGKLYDIAVTKYGEQSTAAQIVGIKLAGMLNQVQAPAGPTNSPRAPYTVEAGPQPPGPAPRQLPVGVDPNDPTVQEAIGVIGAEQGEVPFNGY